MNDTENPLTRGVLIQLSRDEAKALFGCPGDAAVLEFVQQLLASGNAASLDTENTWQQLSGAFGSEPPLCWCFLGGRPMFQGGSHQIVLVRPDMVGHVAVGLSKADCDQLAESAEEAALLEKVRDHYQQADESRCAMIFAVEN